jgi:Fe-S cluster assembly protein SufD
MATSFITAHPFGDAYAARAGALPATPWLESLRNFARAEIAGGLPGPRVEDWRFTPLAQLAKQDFIPAASADDVDVTTVPLGVPTIAGAIRVVLVNGFYRADLSDAVDGVIIQTLNDAIASSKDRECPVGRIAPLSLPMVALNTVFMDGGLSITAERTVARPVHIVSIGASGSRPVAFHPRIVIAAEPGASVSVVETHIGLPGQPFFANPVTEIVVAPDATVRRYVAVSEDSDAYHLATTVASVADRGTFQAFHLGLGGQNAEGTIRQEIHAIIKGEGANVNVSGAYAIAGGMHHDFTTVINHRVPGSVSKQLFKGALDGRSHGVYQGRLRVAPDAQKTDARQLHKALFLTQGPAVDVKPELEIDADDVQCAHGAATGALDADQLFYFMARGIDPDTARALLVEGFLNDALAEIGDEAVHAAFTGQVSNWLLRRGGAS